MDAALNMDNMNAALNVNIMGKLESFAGVYSRSYGSI